MSTARPYLRSGATALVTGASAGLGVEFASRLAERGLDLVLVARRKERLDALAGRLRETTGCTVTVIAADLSKPNAAEELVSVLTRQGIAVEVLVNNAGLGTVGDVLETDPATISEVLQVNVAALTMLTRLIAPSLVSAGHGAIVNVASLAALLPSPHMAVYGATKAYVHSFSEAIAVELRGTGVHVLTVDPGPTRTEFFDRSGGQVGPDSAYLTPAMVVQAALGALDRPRPPLVVVPGRGNRLAAPVIARLPRAVGLALSERLMRMGTPAKTTGGSTPTAG